ncbi:MAG TPA: hypothetical protein VGL40_02265 [Bacillota bacterium]
MPRRKAFPDITDDFALDELLYEQADVDRPYPEGPVPGEGEDPDGWPRSREDYRLQAEDPYDYPDSWISGLGM